MSRHHHLNLPKIKVPEYNALSTPEATPHSSLFNSFTHNTSNSSSTKPIFLPNTPIQTPHSSSTHSFPPLPSLKSLGNSLLRPTSASNTTLPPLVLPNTAYLSSPPAPQQIPHPKSPSSTVSLPPINEFSVPSPYSRPPQPLPPNAWCDQFYPTPNTPAYSPFTPLPYVPQHTNVPHAAGLGIFVPDNASPKNPQPFKNFIKAPPASREIKRRTKTGCMTCRKRRIKVCYTDIATP